MYGKMRGEELFTNDIFKIERVAVLGYFPRPFVIVAAHGMTP